MDFAELFRFRSFFLRHRHANTEKRHEGDKQEILSGFISHLHFFRGITSPSGVTCCRLRAQAMPSRCLLSSLAPAERRGGQGCAPRREALDPLPWSSPLGRAKDGRLLEVTHPASQSVAFCLTVALCDGSPAIRGEEGCIAGVCRKTRAWGIGLMWEVSATLEQNATSAVSPQAPHLHSRFEVAVLLPTSRTVDVSSTRRSFGCRSRGRRRSHRGTACSRDLQACTMDRVRPHPGRRNRSTSLRELPMRPHAVHETRALSASPPHGCHIVSWKSDRQAEAIGGAFRHLDAAERLKAVPFV